MNKLYLISGLGADERAFSRLGDFKLEKVYVKWIKNKENETLHSYSLRLIKEYGITALDKLVGLSFGGVLAQQIAEILGTNSVILISSFETRNHLHFLFRNGLRSKGHKLIPKWKAPIISEIVAYYLNSGSKQSRPTLKAMLESTDMELMKWSIEKIYELSDPIAPKLTKHNIIGTDDRIVKPWQNDNTYKLEGGSHFMVYDKAGEISDIIRSIL